MQCGERTGAGVASWGSWPGPLRQGRGGAHRLACLLPDGKGESVLGHFQEADVVPGLLRPPPLPAGVGHAVLPPTDLQPFLWTWPEPEWRRMGVYRGTSHTLTLSWPLQHHRTAHWEQIHLHVASDAFPKAEGASSSFHLPTTQAATEVTA